MRHLFLLSFVLTVACGGNTAGPASRAVGGACTLNSDCDQTCLSNQTFPAGYCTRPCASDGDCASGSMCVKDDFGQICEVLCSAVENCTVFGPKFACDQKALAAASGSVTVCRSH